MGRIVRAVAGLVLIAAGVTFTLQGLDLLGGSAMSGKTLWVVLGPIVALVGLALLLRSGRKQAAHDDPV